MEIQRVFRFFLRGLGSRVGMGVIFFSIRIRICVVQRLEEFVESGFRFFIFSFVVKRVLFVLCIYIRSWREFVLGSVWRKISVEGSGVVLELVFWSYFFFVFISIVGNSCGFIGVLWLVVVWVILFRFVYWVWCMRGFGQSLFIYLLNII